MYLILNKNQKPHSAKLGSEEEEVHQSNEAAVETCEHGGSHLLLFVKKGIQFYSKIPMSAKRSWESTNKISCNFIRKRGSASRILFYEQQFYSKKESPLINNA